jgi:hypothetical protein
MVDIQNIDLMGIDAECATVNCLIEYYQKQLLMENIYQEGIGDERLAYRGTDENGNKENLFMSILKFIGRLINNLVYQSKKLFNKNNMNKIESAAKKSDHIISDNPKIAEEVIGNIERGHREIEQPSNNKKGFISNILNDDKMRKTVMISAGIIGTIGLIATTAGIAHHVKMSDYKGHINENINNMGDERVTNPNSNVQMYQAHPEKLKKIKGDDGNKYDQFITDTTKKYLRLSQNPNNRDYNPSLDVYSELVLDPSKSNKDTIMYFETTSFDIVNTKMTQQREIINKIISFTSKQKLEKAGDFIKKNINLDDKLFNHNSNYASLKIQNMSTDDFILEFNQFSKKLDGQILILNKLYSDFSKCINIMNDSLKEIKQNDQIPIQKKIDGEMAINTNMEIYNSIINVIKKNAVYCEGLQAYRNSMRSIIIYLNSEIVNKTKIDKQESKMEKERQRYERKTNKAKVENITLEQSKNNTTITNGFKNYVQKKDLKSIRITLKNTVYQDPSKEDYNANVAYLKEKDPELYNQLYETHDGTKFNEDKSSWDKKYLNQIQVDLSDNFSRQRVDHLFEVAQYINSI